MSNRPKPTAVKLAEGNRGHRPLEGDDFQPEHIMPEMPKELRRSKAGRREWNIMSRILFERNVLTVVDGKALAAYCWTYARWEEASALIDLHGQVVPKKAVTKDGEEIILELQANPACALADKWLNRMKSYLIEFGLTPASRGKLKLPVKPKEDEFDKVMGHRPRPTVGFQVPAGPVNKA
jgi:P27 family predicted phage terminase small subunit